MCLSDMRNMKLPAAFPTYIIPSAKSIDISHDLVPVDSAAHYTMGGIATDTYGQTFIWLICLWRRPHWSSRSQSFQQFFAGRIVFGQRIVDKVEEILYRRSIKTEEIFKQYDPGLSTTLGEQSNPSRPERCRILCGSG